MKAKDLRHRISKRIALLSDIHEELYQLLAEVANKDQTIFTFESKTLYSARTCKIEWLRFSPVCCAVFKRKKDRPPLHLGFLQDIDLSLSLPQLFAVPEVHHVT